MYFDLPFNNPESVYDGEYLIADYIVFGLDESAALMKVGSFAAGQTVGTWLPLPGITRDMIENYQARVIGLYMIPCDEPFCLLRVAFPFHNFGENFAMMMTALIGNDVSTALRIKLIDIEITGKALSFFSGPSQGIEGIRELVGVYDRPLVLNMIKPCTGFSPEKGAMLFYESGMGGVDIIKDDEVLGETPVSAAAKRVACYMKASDRIKSENGKAPLYIVNITDKPALMMKKARAVIDAGAKAVMVNFVATGPDSLSELTSEFGGRLFFLAHYAGCGIMNSSVQGISNPVLLGIIPRLAGADSVMTMYPGSPGNTGYLEYLQTIQKQKLPLGKIKPVMTAVGGGITPLNLGEVIRELGNDVILGVGGAIQGHSLGATSGAKAVMQAVDAAVRDIPLNEKAESSPELSAAIKQWG